MAGSIFAAHFFEYLLNIRKATQDNLLTPFLDAAGRPERRRISSSGFFVFADYQFHKVFSVGSRYDWSQAPYSTDNTASAVAVWFGFYPVEETLAFRLQYQHTSLEDIGQSQSINSIALQILFSLGPHRAHQF